MVAPLHPSRPLKPGTPGWSAEDLEIPEVRWQWENTRYELRDGVIVAPGFGPSTATRVMPGSSGWSIHDLESDRFREEWENGRFELIEGVIVEMPPPALSHSYPVHQLLAHLQVHCAKRGQKVVTATEVDVFISEHLVPTVDGVLLTADELRAEREHLRASGQSEDWFGKIHVAPTLIIESASLGRERHDYQTKRRYYERFGVKNYWVLNARKRTVLCLRLVEGAYQETDAVRGDRFAPPAFEGFEVPLDTIFIA